MNRHELTNRLREYKTIQGMLNFLNKEYNTGESQGTVKRALIADQLARAVITLGLKEREKEDKK